MKGCELNVSHRDFNKLIELCLIQGNLITALNNKINMLIENK